MIRLLDEADRDDLLRFAGAEPEANLFMLGDVENHGIATSSQRVWGEFDDAGRFRAALLQFHDNLVFYAPDGCDRDAFVRLVASLDFKYFTGGAASLERFCDAIPSRSVKRMTLCRLADATRIAPPASPAPIRPLLLADVDRAIGLYSSIPELGAPGREAFVGDLAAGCTRGCWIEQNGEMVSIARTGAENSRSAMIIGVGTREGFRGRGYATALMADLCRSLVADGRIAVLFFDNPVAGKIYLGMGFEPAGAYMAIQR